ncbi:hypothetical protein RY831_32645 [Noviherbaspirillum sp. CPCC 100848]|uniref:Uncharacterized protein n=1 Tax=Noviherbaspirillum album TaxID=3080276 RepID=A0ABU6JGQ8_9BURK|nr:hypothetical protein [Noviherbaspirillum sp. CPCC 100848]MEC4722851.1 hypothetical protein [Noviherbaspirillum sp. CPCC 100848]MEC4723857.1 hypothetical protein [Noviherbaspirillum sp. CPCC 100848]
MKIKTRTKYNEQLHEPKDGNQYIVILHDGQKVEGQWSAVTSRFYLDQTQSIFVLRQEAFDWWPANV